MGRGGGAGFAGSSATGSGSAAGAASGSATGAASGSASGAAAAGGSVEQILIAASATVGARWSCCVMPTHEQLNSPTIYVSLPLSSLSPKMKSAVHTKGNGSFSNPRVFISTGRSALNFAIIVANSGASAPYVTYLAPDASVAEIPPSAGFLWMISVGVS